MKQVLIYLQKIFHKWYYLLGILPGLFGFIAVYSGISIPSIPLLSSYIVAFLSLFYATYLVYVDQDKEIKKITSKYPKLELRFQNDKKGLIANTKIIEKKLIETKSSEEKVGQFSNVFEEMNTAASVLANIIPSNNAYKTENKVIGEIHDEFIEIKFKLKNVGSVPASLVNIAIDVPEGLEVYQSIPEMHESSFNSIPIISSSNKEYTERRGYYDGQIHLESAAVQHTKEVNFPEIYIRPKQAGEYELNFKLISNELPPDMVEGKLKIKVNIETQTKFLTSQEEIDKEVEIREEELELCKF